MAEAGTFEEFVTTRSSGLLRVATLLTRDHAMAEDLLQTALARSWSVWKRIDGDPEPYVYRILANTYKTWWRRRWHAERPTERLPELGEPGGQLSVETRDEIWRALNRLPRQQRAVLVLRYFEDLTEAQVGQTLGISLGAVKSHANRGLAKLRLDPQLLAEFPVPRPPASIERLPAVRQRVRQHRQHKVMGAIAIIIAVVAGFAVAPSLLRNVFPPTRTQTPKHIQGYLIRDTVSAKLTELDRVTTTAWIPSTLDYLVSGSCDTRDVRFVAKVSVQLNGKIFEDFPCSAEPERLGTRTDSDDASTARLKIGEPVTISLRLQILHGDTIPPDSTLTLAFAELVPFEQLPLPPRPKRLKPLDRHISEQPAAVLGPHSPTTATVTLPVGTYLHVNVGSQTPGKIHIEVNGHPRRAHVFWDYDNGYGGFDLIPNEKGAADLGVHEGVPILISVWTEYLTADWYVALFVKPKTW
ncbi:hypothetical protein Rhe02_05010 [Rhizocola hellebori]|uniref:SigE family RNA polymerase sigma factor n=1 Tax=Rhizocola hellebori TaxID=1392758 RepID=A0A8J3Q2T4_9ACTN|nr:SigE family RNA polymerase sigma factor [Rhizocola hellebori]GIH02434.1 hypothetical protein Rhe02_05010 [Rhizocola hellebori]